MVLRARYLRAGGISRDLIILIALSLLLILVNLWHLKTTYRSMKTLEVFPRPSTYNPGPSGTKALYSLLIKLGIKVDRLREPFTQLPTNSRLLILIVPSEALIFEQIDKEEVKALKRWLKSGGTFLLLTDTKNFNLGLILDPFDVNFQATDQKKVKLAPKVLSRYSLEIGNLSVDSDIRIRPEKGNYIEHFGDATGGLVNSFPYGRGELILISDPLIFSNRRINQSDNVLLAANIFFNCSKGTQVLFDEYHHGYKKIGSVIDVALMHPVKWVLLQLILALGLIFLRLGRRFGRPIVIEEGKQLRPAYEYVQSMANLYRKARASAVVLKNLYRGFKAQMANFLGVSMETPNKVLVNLLQMRKKFESEKLLALLENCERIASQKESHIPESQLLKIAQDLDKYIQILTSLPQAGMKWRLYPNDLRSESNKRVSQ